MNADDLNQAHLGSSAASAVPCAAAASCIMCTLRGKPPLTRNLWLPHVVLCSAGTWEPYAPDADDFPDEVKGGPYEVRLGYQHIQ
jgi:hypothetical protein